MLVSCAQRGGGRGGSGDDSDFDIADDDDNDDAGSDDDDGDDDDSLGAGDPCSPDGVTTCVGANFLLCVDSVWVVDEICSGETPVCSSTLGCLACNPGLRFCQGLDVYECDDVGASSDFVETCEDFCLSGVCTTQCEAAASQYSYLGCEFLAVSTTNLVEPVFDDDFAVIIGNPETNPVTEVTVTQGGTLVSSDTLGPGETAAIQLPMVQSLKTAIESVVVPGGAYEVTTDHPVVAYQYNPLNFYSAASDMYSHTNDASLLLPEHTLANEYLVTSVASFGVSVEDSTLGFLPPFVAVAATQDGTVVTLEVSGDTATGNPAATPAGNTATVELNRGDVVQVLGDYPTLAGSDEAYCTDQGWESTTAPCPGIMGGNCLYCLITDSDLTGSRITSTAPVAVWAGHRCSFVPYTNWACDHLEEMMLPTVTWGQLVVMTAPVYPDGTGVARALYRVLARNDNTTVSFDPPVTSSQTLGAREHFEFESNGDFVVQADGPISVSQFLLGQDELGSTRGDPAMGTGIPWLQVRRDYDFLTPSTFERDYLNVVAPSGSIIELDGAEVINWETIGDTGYSVSRILLQPGSHHIESLDGSTFGITSYGYALYTSYLYPGGLNLSRQ